MTKVAYSGLREAVEHVLNRSRPLRTEPNGLHYHYGSHNVGYLQQLGILGERRRIKRDELGAMNHPNGWTSVRPVNYERAEQVLDQLNRIERGFAPVDERYRSRESFRKKLSKLQIDLESLR